MKNKKARKVISILSAMAKDLLIDAILLVSAFLIIAAVFGGIYVAAYFGSKIWIEGTVDQYPILAEMFSTGVNANTACGIIAICVTILGIGLVMAVSKFIKYLRGIYEDIEQDSDSH